MSESSFEMNGVDVNWCSLINTRSGVINEHHRRLRGIGCFFAKRCLSGSKDAACGDKEDDDTDQMDNEKERVVAADIENDLSLCGQVGMRPFGMLMEDISELNSDVTSKALDVEKEIRLNLPSPSTEVIGSREIASHAGACGGQTKELENDEVSKQSTSDPSYEKTVYLFGFWWM